MSRQKYIFDSEKLTYVKVRKSMHQRLLRLSVLFLASIILAFIYAKIYATFFETPKAAFLQTKSSDLRLKYNLLLRDIETSQATVSEITQRDRNVYRAIFGLNELSIPLESYVGNVDESSEFYQVQKSLSNLRHQVYLQSKSFDEVGRLAINMNNLSACVPAIQPLNLKKVRSYDEYGWRRHPIYHVMKHHDGLDFATDVGTPVYSTGDGVVTDVKYSFTGYGNVVDIDHGFGYKTRYAHLSKILVRRGMKVKRGEEIALSGKSGGVTGPHLHYEVHYMGQTLNPRKFFPADQSEINYNEVVHKNK